MASSGGTHAGKTIKAVETALAVLAELRERGAVTLAELDGALPQSKSTLHHHLATLEQAGLVESEDGTYRLGLELLAYGSSARDAAEVFDVARETVDRLARETGELARLAVLRDDSAVVVHQAAGEHVDRPWSELGDVEPLHGTAVGKALLAGLPEKRADEVLSRSLAGGSSGSGAHADSTVGSDAGSSDGPGVGAYDGPDAGSDGGLDASSGDGPGASSHGGAGVDAGELRSELDDVRSDGVAFADEEHREGVRAVATAITDETGQLLGAVGVAGSTRRLDDERFRSELPCEVRNVAGVAEVAATYADWADGS